ncbi:hypothetical protein BU23DRAFT_637735 [Bimuria novae-zelandiae CBS 107.79]|uniref:Uncharacterized protein n=1 Tax=Bimuria novae-zelandiae CBS 107.79 TaxID=1447943 RepID=A0A6A5VE96_9PLEO|nr:hypothetical protein BU23DRAFT_637735 [Bimuria novae-zelandiae CBS 107.79]
MPSVYTSTEFENYTYRTGFPSLKNNGDSDDKYSHMAPCHESHDEVHAKDECLTQQVEQIFATIKATEDYIQPHQPNDVTANIELVIVTPVQVVDANSFCMHRIKSAWRAHLLRAKQLPEVTSVRSLSICNPEGPEVVGRQTHTFARLSWRVVLDLAAKCPNLRLSGHIRAQRSGAPNFVGTAQHDLFSSSLHLLGPTLRRLDIRLIADTALFHPPGNPPHTLWPNLEFLNVTFHLVTPSGAWYFRGTPEFAAAEAEPSTGYTIEASMYPRLRNPNCAAPGQPLA